MELKISFTENQLKRLGEITANAGHVFLASIVIPFLASAEKLELSWLLAGLTLTFGCWILSLAIAGITNND